jgi:hypothetical protein
MGTQESNAQQSIRLLKRAFRQHGYVRMPHAEKRKTLGQTYKKGYEVRLVATSKTELQALRRWIKLAGLTPGKPFEKTNRMVQPVYGQVAVEWFLSRSTKPVEAG